VFNLTGSELVVILLIALVVLGPEKLPEAIRRVGRLYSELRKMSNGFQEEFTSAMSEPLDELRSSSQMLSSSVDFTVDDSPEEPSPEILNHGGDAPSEDPGTDPSGAQDAPVEPDGPGPKAENPEQSGSDR
jgi:sec-independent protein translocase protein TatB